jgi:FtsZ-interacting cell division protein ZipA
MERRMPAQLFIVARRDPELYEYLSARLADDANVAVVLDRRLAPRRRRAQPAAAERRRAERRARPDVDERLRAISLAVVTAPKTAEAPAGEAPAVERLTGETPASEARQWVESLQRGVQAVRGALDDHERLRHEAAAVRREHARLQHEAQTLRLENERLRAEIDRWWKELAGLDASLGRAIAVVTDLQSRLHKEPPSEPGR